MPDDPHVAPHMAWAHFRFSVVGPLLSAPPPRGGLKDAIAALSEKTWRHPISGEPVHFAAGTIERWYYRARRARQDPVGVLRRRVRKDAGTRSALSDRLADSLIKQYREHRRWSVKLHHDNVCAMIDADPTLGRKPSYASVRRFMRANGLERLPRRRGSDRPGMARADEHLERREVRSFEAAYVNGLWHMDFHVSSLNVLTPSGQWVHPRLLGVLDDRSRLACHVQWYWSETAEDLVHGLVQAFCKRGMPGKLLTDNGSAMVAEEVEQGLGRLGVIYDHTLPNCPHQNGKQEVFWLSVEGRLMAMLENTRELTLGLLNEATQAWVEMEYNRTEHSEIGQAPLDRFLEGPHVGRPSPSSQRLHEAFRQQTTRVQRRSDGTIALEGRRYELPNRFRHLRQVTVRYARWNLRSVHVVDPRTDALLAPIYPLDKTRNADGRRRALKPIEPQAEPATPDGDGPAEIAPLLRKLMADYAATGLPPAYLPKPPTEPPTEHIP